MVTLNTFRTCKRKQVFSGITFRFAPAVDLNKFLKTDQITDFTRTLFLTYLLVKLPELAGNMLIHSGPVSRIFDKAYKIGLNYERKSSTTIIFAHFLF